MQLLHRDEPGGLTCGGDKAVIDNGRDDGFALDACPASFPYGRHVQVWGNYHHASLTPISR